MNENETSTSKFPTGREVKLSQCCGLLAKQNRRLEQALEKEKKRRKKVEHALQQLLLAYNSVIDVHRVCDTYASSDDSESDNELFNDDEKENFSDVDSDYYNGSVNEQTGIQKPTSSIDAQIEKEIMPTPKIVFRNRISAQHKPHSTNSLTPLKMKQKCSTPTHTVSKDYINSKVDDTIVKRNHIPCSTTSSNAFDNNTKTVSTEKRISQTPEWYFLSLDNEENLEQKETRRRSRIHSWLQNSEERRHAISSTSKHRAAIAANRRLVAIDILRGRRQLDEEAFQILHTDSSTLSSFPECFMRRMRSISRKKYLESQKRLEKEQGNYRQKQLQMATNKILAHTSATITKCMVSKKMHDSGKYCHS